MDRGSVERRVKPTGDAGTINTLRVAYQVGRGLGVGRECRSAGGGRAKTSLVPRPLPLIKMRAGRGSGGMTRFLTDPRRNAGAHSIAIVLSS